MIFLDNDHVEVEDPIGLAHYKSSAALEIASENCQLCALIHASVERLRQEGQTLTGHLWLTKPIHMLMQYFSDESGPGFMVFDGRDSDDQIFLIAAFGICVEDGKCGRDDEINDTDSFAR